MGRAARPLAPQDHPEGRVVQWNVTLVHSGRLMEYVPTRGWLAGPAPGFALSLQLFTSPAPMSTISA